MGGMSARLGPMLVAAFATLPLPAQNSIQLTNGVMGGVSFPHDVRQVPQSGITVEAWITFDDSTIPSGINVPSYRPTIARQNPASGLENWCLCVDAGSFAYRLLRFQLRTVMGLGPSVTYQFAPGEFANWTHIAATYDGQDSHIYKNGIEVATGFSFPDAVRDNGGTLVIGNGDPAALGRDTWNGRIDELRIWPMARTGEVLAAKDQELHGMIGNVLSFHMNGSYDEETGLTGTPFGVVTFAPSAPVSPHTPIVLQLGVPTSTCARQAHILVGSAPVVGNLDFTFWAVNGPRSNEAPFTIIAAAGAPAPIGQPPILGLDLAFDAPTLIVTNLVSPGTTWFGTASYVLPLPGTQFLGLGWVFQYVFFDLVCSGPSMLSSSDGMSFVTQ
jgi:hypothetical protein